MTDAPAPQEPAEAGPGKANRAIEAAHRFDNDQTILVRDASPWSPGSSPACWRRSTSRAWATCPANGPVILAINHISNGDPVVVGGVADARPEAAPHPLDGQARDLRLAGHRLGRGPRRHPPGRSRRTPTSRPSGWPRRSWSWATCCSCSRRGRAARRARSRRPRTAWRCSPCAPGATIVPIGVNNTDAVLEEGPEGPAAVPAPHHHGAHRRAVRGRRRGPAGRRPALRQDPRDHRDHGPDRGAARPPPPRRLRRRRPPGAPRPDPDHGPPPSAGSPHVCEHRGDMGSVAGSQDRQPDRLLLRRPRGDRQGQGVGRGRQGHAHPGPGRPQRGRGPRPQGARRPDGRRARRRRPRRRWS